MSKIDEANWMREIFEDEEIAHFMYETDWEDKFEYHEKRKASCEAPSAPFQGVTCH